MRKRWAAGWIVVVVSGAAGGGAGCLGAEAEPASGVAGVTGGVEPGPTGPGVGGGTSVAGAADAVTTGAAENDAEAPADAAATGGLVVHEWGTFTSVQGSDGVTLEGLHHEEEALPPFVHGRDLGTVGRKAMETLPEGVTQKLETPVLYFYGATGHVDVDVRFPEGVISQYYPDAAGFEPAIGALQGVRDGAMRWAVDLDAGIPASAFPWVPEDHLWAPSREVPEATPLRVGGELERFIFYRGVGRFDLPLRVRAATDVALAVANESPDAVPAAFVLRVTADGGAVDAVGALPAGATTTVSPRAAFEPLERYAVTAESAIAAALEASGLTADESSAMVRTWSRSWFRQPGTRVLYVVPRPWTDGLLPLTITPTPKALVRTLVGRIEVLTAAEEARLLGVVEAAAIGGHGEVPAALGRFAEPKLRRVCPLVDDPAAAAYCADLVNQAMNAL